MAMEPRKQTRRPFSSERQNVSFLSHGGKCPGSSGGRGISRWHSATPQDMHVSSFACMLCFEVLFSAFPSCPHAPKQHRMRGPIVVCRLRRIPGTFFAQRMGRGMKEAQRNCSRCPRATRPDMWSRSQTAPHLWLQSRFRTSSPYLFFSGGPCDQISQTLGKARRATTGPNTSNHRPDRPIRLGTACSSRDRCASRWRSRRDRGRWCQSRWQTHSPPPQAECRGSP
mmetsp:Transcript_11227/g.30806  ORF Transcript_11227/g.30806 Transcript_11227/m.30806 type:complete len:226 (+) Transcript_11227:134-811(+)